MADELDDDWEDDEPDTPPVQYYANRIRTLPGLFDVSIDFACQVGTEPPEQLVRVTMTWEEAHVLQRFLSAAVQHFEGIVGAPVRDIEGLDTGQGNGGVSRRDEEEDEDDGTEDADG